MDNRDAYRLAKHKESVLMRIGSTVMYVPNCPVSIYRKLKRGWTEGAV